MEEQATVLIVEDDYVVREGIIRSIAWQQNALTICGQAGDGREGFAMVQRHRPDIVITDIRMPVEDGLQLAGNIYAYDPDTRVVILSGYDDFAYARKALQLGVRDYLLKPPDADALLETVVNLRGEVLEARSARLADEQRQELLDRHTFLLRDELLRKLIFGAGEEGYATLKPQLEALHVRLPGPRYKVALVAVDDYALLTKDMGREDKEALIAQMRDLLEAALAGQGHLALYLPESACFALLLNLTAYGRLHVHEAARKMQREMRECFGFTTTVSLGREQGSLGGLHTSYKEALLALRRRAYLSGNHLLEYDPRMDTPPEELLEIGQEELALMEKIRAYQVEGITDGLKAFFDDVRRRQVDFRQLKSACVRLVMITLSTLEEMSIPTQRQLWQGFDPVADIELYDNVESLYQWMEKLFRQVAFLLEQAQSERYQAPVTQAMRYVEAHYPEEMRIEQIARVVSMSPSHFSRVFKSQTGTNFVDYLNQYRIRKAKPMLLDLNKKIYHVAEATGYQNYKYFSYIFGKYEGMTPREYRNQSGQVRTRP